MQDVFYTVEELANMLKVNPRTVVSLIKRKKLKALNVGTDKRAYYRIYEGQYLEFVAQSYE